MAGVQCKNAISTRNKSPILRAEPCFLTQECFSFVDSCGTICPTTNSILVVKLFTSQHRLIW